MDGRGSGVSLAGPGMCEVESTEDQSQLGGGDGQFLTRCRWEGEGAPLEASKIQGEPVSFPGQDFEPVARLVLEHEQVARGGVTSEGGGDNRRQPVDPLASVLGFDGQEDPASGAKCQHG